MVGPEPVSNTLTSSCLSLHWFLFRSSYWNAKQALAGLLIALLTSQKMEKLPNPQICFQIFSGKESALVSWANRTGNSWSDPGDGWGSCKSTATQLIHRTMLQGRNAVCTAISAKPFRRNVLCRMIKYSFCFLIDSTKPEDQFVKLLVKRKWCSLDS